MRLHDGWVAETTTPTGGSPGFIGRKKEKMAESVDFNFQAGSF